jgi:hypothetical protein
MFYCKRREGRWEEPERGGLGHSPAYGRSWHPGSIMSLVGAVVPNTDDPAAVGGRPDGDLPTSKTAIQTRRRIIRAPAPNATAANTVSTTSSVLRPARAMVPTPVFGI